MSALDDIDIHALVRDGAVHSSVYTDPRVFRLEMERLFGRAWLLVGHESQWSAPGDFVAARIGLAPILVLRTASGWSAVRNRCTHRGARLHTEPRGHVRQLSCPYHAWTFSLEGRLTAIPQADEYAPAERQACEDLAPVGRVEAYRGFVFVRGAADGPSLAEWLGRMRGVIDDLVDRAPGDAVEASPVLLRHRYRGNWKLTFENLNDTLHAGVAHAAAASAAKRVIDEDPALAQTPILGMMVANAKPLAFFRGLEMWTTEWGHSSFGAHMPAGYPEPLQTRYREALARARGDEAADRILSVQRHVALCYPGSSWHARYQTVRLVQPLAPDLTEVVTIVFRLAGAPPETFESALSYCNGASSALSTVITDDLELYEGIQRNAATAPGWMPVSRGLRPGAGPEPAVQPATHEAYIRAQYRAWLRWLAPETAS